MHWVLIILISAGGKPAVATAEFTDELLCKTIATAVKIDAQVLYGPHSRVVANCFAKG